METIRVNGHVANDKEGIIFLQNNEFLKVNRKLFNLIMKKLMKEKKIVVSNNLTLTYR